MISFFYIISHFISKMQCLSRKFQTLIICDYCDYKARFVLKHVNKQCHQICSKVKKNLRNFQNKTNCSRNSSTTTSWEFSIMTQSTLGDSTTNLLMFYKILEFWNLQHYSTFGGSKSRGFTEDGRLGGLLQQQSRTTSKENSSRKLTESWWQSRLWKLLDFDKFEISNHAKQWENNLPTIFHPI